jgi:hypothetical protein
VSAGLIPLIPHRQLVRHLRLVALPAGIGRGYFGFGSIIGLHVIAAVAGVATNLNLTVAALFPVSDYVWCCLGVAFNALSRDVLNRLRLCKDR